MQLTGLESMNSIDIARLKVRRFGMVDDDLGCIRPYDGRVLVASQSGLGLTTEILGVIGQR